MKIDEEPQYVCVKPFLWLDVQQKGECYLCCPSWLPKSIGKLDGEEGTVTAVWNSPGAQEIRRSVTDGSFRHCRTDICPDFQSKSRFVVRTHDIKEPGPRSAIDNGETVLPYGPVHLNLSYDRSCNLACPTCRVDFYSARGEELLSIKNVHDEVIRGAAAHAEWICVTGSGDPFASSHFRALLSAIDRGLFPVLKKVHLHTNAQLWTASVWNGFKHLHKLVTTAEISVDAGSAGTYAINRRGGDWDRLLENLEFISSLNIEVTLSFVVQENNFLEMPAFAQLARGYGFRPYFSKLSNWGTFSHEEFLRRAIHLKDHPRNAEFEEVLSLLRNGAPTPKPFLGLRFKKPHSGVLPCNLSAFATQ